MPELAQWCQQHSFNDAIKLRREIQQALAYYAKYNKMDKIQEKALAITNKLEKWCRDFFLKNEITNLIRINPALAKRPMSVKQFAKDKWEKLIKQQSY